MSGRTTSNTTTSTASSSGGGAAQTCDMEGTHGVVVRSAGPVAPTSTSTATSSPASAVFIAACRGERYPGDAQVGTEFLPHKALPITWFSYGLDWLGWTASWIWKNPIFQADDIRRIVREMCACHSPMLGDMSPALRAWDTWLSNFDLSHVPYNAHFMVNGTMHGLAEAGLKICRYTADHPELSQKPLNPIMFISGLPRAGTTILHNLVASDPRNRGIHLFEMHHLVSPTPPAKSKEALLNDPRIEECKKHFFGLHRFIKDYWPAVAESHFTGPESIDEENYIMSWMGLFFIHGIFAGDAYMDYYLEPDKNFLYRVLRTFLQILNSGFAPENLWIYKCPAHNLWLDALLQEIPDARVLFIHRNPAETIPSWAALQEVMMSHFYHDGKWNRRDIAKSSLRMWRTAAYRGMEWQQRTDPKHWYNIFYKDFLADPTGCLEKAYEHFGIPYTEEARTAMKAWLAANPQGKHGRRHYTPEMYGMTTASLEEAFGEYLNRHCYPGSH
ncbi:sulfotransferase [Pelomyxa schiedti]|nr:sulfotransferase [Pelomyxa schiedti]